MNRNTVLAIFPDEQAAQDAIDMLKRTEDGAVPAVKGITPTHYSFSSKQDRHFILAVPFVVMAALGIILASYIMRNDPLPAVLIVESVGLVLGASAGLLLGGFFDVIFRGSLEDRKVDALEYSALHEGYLVAAKESSAMTKDNLLQLFKELGAVKITCAELEEASAAQNEKAPEKEYLKAS